MCKIKIDMSSSEEEDDSFESGSDTDMTDSTSSDDDMNQEASTSGVNGEAAAGDNDYNSEDDDELVKAIKAAKEKKKEHPPDLEFEDLIVDVSFHPGENIIALASIVGDVLLYKYSIESNELLDTLENHTKACRAVEFNEDGSLLYSCAKDKCIMVTDTQTGKLKRFYEEAHEDPLYSLHVISDNLFSTGDEEGTVKVWDIRQSQPVVAWNHIDDFVSDMITNERKRHLVCTSGDGCLTTFDLNTRKLFVQSEEYEAELSALQLFRNGTRVAASSSKGQIFLFNWGEFGLHSDEYSGPKNGINSIIGITENIGVLAYDDGSIRALNWFPHQYLGNVGQHKLSVESMDISHDGEFIASCALDQTVRFWNIKYFEDVHVKREKRKKKDDLQNNLPSSKVRNSSDFFSGLA